MYTGLQTEVTGETEGSITGRQTVSIVKLVLNRDASLRADRSPLEEFAIKTSTWRSTSEVRPTVEAQIKQQQDMIMQVQTSIAESKRAEQTALTAAKNGEPRQPRPSGPGSDQGEAGHGS